ncbi:MAG: SMI1/KNR4 family protein, partial [Deltaproteobacteria bacterium]|nr:SMI1/KNR4 family protein [Deltaproteobacteria bacterium]
MSELADTIREALRALAASDRSRKRFGAARHRYELAPCVNDLPAELPPDLQDFATRIGSAGAGPGYG